MMALSIAHKVQTHFQDVNAHKLETVQSLWSDYGEIARYAVPSQGRSYIVKCVDLGNVDLSHAEAHPRGWNTSTSHQRKISSYFNEQCFYQSYAPFTNSFCKVPQCYASGANNDVIWMILEDLDESGYQGRISGQLIDNLPQPIFTKNINSNDHPVKLALHWLANFHARFLVLPKFGAASIISPEQTLHKAPLLSSPEHIARKERATLWPIGTYWHLSTRKDEYSKMQDCKLKEAAIAIDKQLNTAKYQTFVHGDAKLANFCFSTMSEKHAHVHTNSSFKQSNMSENKGKIAALDFQYVGKGAGIKDVAYLLGGCFNNDELFEYGDMLLDYYFSCLRQALTQAVTQAVTMAAIENEWRALYCYAWADFERFLRGWSPDHSKLNRYSAWQCEKALNDLGLI